MQIKLISGNFQAIVSGSVSSGNVNVGTEKEPKLQPAQDVINDCGLTYIGQRDGWTSFYKPRLKKGQERSELEFSEDLALEVATSLETTLSPYLDGINVDVTEHVPSEAAPSMKSAQSLWNSVKDTPVGASYRAAFGEDEENIVKQIHAGLMADRKPRAKKATTTTAQAE